MISVLLQFSIYTTALIFVDYIAKTLVYLVNTLALDRRQANVANFLAVSKDLRALASTAT